MPLLTHPRDTLCRHLRRLAAISSLVLSAAGSQAAEKITVRLRSGRSFTAAVDSRTDNERLWLRFDGRSAALLRPIAWERVESAWYGGKPVSRARLQDLAADLESTRPREFRPSAVEELPVPAGPARHATPKRRPGRALQPGRRLPLADDWGDRPDATLAGPSALAPASPVRSLALDAHVANWDDDVEVDGLVVRPVALDAAGFPLAVDGTLEVELLGDRPGPTSRAGRFGPLGRWVRRLSALDAAAQTAVYRLEFQAMHPEFQWDTSPFGMVHARLSVPGHGTFETTTGTIRIRPYSAVRDRLQQAEDTRFFPSERTGRGQRHRPQTGL